MQFHTHKIFSKSITVVYENKSMFKFMLPYEKNIAVGLPTLPFSKLEMLSSLYILIMKNVDSHIG